MRSSAPRTGLATLACAVSLCATATLAAHPPAAPSASVSPDSEHPAARALAPARATPDEAALRLGRAAMERSNGNLRGVVENLEAIDYSTEPAFLEADRAAFLLGQAYLELGGRARFVELARQVATWRRTSAYTRWLAFQLAIVETDLAGAPASASDSTGATARPAAGHAAADALAAGVLLRDGNAAGALALIAAIKAQGQATPLVTWLEAQALAATGADDGPTWSRLAESDTTSPLGRDLAGDALIRLATRAAARGEDPRPLLARVPAGSRVASRARHMAGVATLERGDTSGVSILAGLSTGDTSYAARREVWLALAGQDLDQGRWESAHRTYRRIDADWAHHRDILQGLLASADLDSLWRAWEANSALSPALMLDALPAQLLAAGLADTSEDLTARPMADLPALDTPAAATASPWAIAPPPAEVWRALASSARDLGESSHALTQTRWAMAREQEALEATRRYLAGGLERARREADSLALHTSLLDSLVRTLAALDGRLRDVRDEATRRVLERTRNLVEGAIGDLRWLAAMRHFHLDGPERERAEPSPQGYPAPDSVVAGEETLARAIQAFAERMAVEGPALIARSYDQAWRPGLIDRAAAQDSAARAALAWARALATSIDSTIAASSTSEDLRRLTARADSLARTTESLRTAYQAARARAAHDAIAAALKGLDEEREAIDYGLAASAYGLGVRLAAPGDSLAAGAVAPPRPATRDSAAAARDTSLAAEGPVDELDEPEAVRWRQDAIALHEAFLENHAGSPARGEIRFRLADLLLVEARREFREQMAAYVKDQAEGGKRGVPLPVLSHDRPLALYRAILAEDLEFEHRDAALFNAGMILADGGDPEAMRMFDRLVTTYPESPYGQESYLRMGDMHFNARRYAESIGLYQRAAAGPDAGLQAIALYKTGWAHYNQDQYAEAAFAFGAVLDLYGTARRPEIEADIEGEAETYLVHSLAGAGGAGAFTAHFARVGKKPYEMRILMALGQHFRRFGLYAQATASDELFLSRYPDHADALLSAERLIDTHQRANLPDRAREARLGFSARFAPGSPWFQAQASDSVRAAGVEFARTSLRTVAQEYHHRARTTHAAADWRAALELYEQVLKSWPDDADAPALALRAGEAGTQLGEYERALGHYETAARSSQDSIATQALWQRVAVTDAWYESTRGGTAAARTGTGSDSLARAVLTAADRLLERFPDHPQGADLLWREGNLAFAHGWLDVSSERFGKLATTHPGDKRAPRAGGIL